VKPSPSSHNYSMAMRTAAVTAGNANDTDNTHKDPSNHSAPAVSWP